MAIHAKPMTTSHPLPDKEKEFYEDEDFIYGWRYVEKNIRGKQQCVRVPLTIDDVLHPQLDEANHRDGQAPPLYGYVLSHHQYMPHGEPENET